MFNDKLMKIMATIAITAMAAAVIYMMMTGNGDVAVEMTK